MLSNEKECAALPKVDRNGNGDIIGLTGLGLARVIAGYCTLCQCKAVLCPHGRDREMKGDEEC